MRKKGSFVITTILMLPCRFVSYVWTFIDGQSQFLNFLRITDEADYSAIELNAQKKNDAFTDISNFLVVEMSRNLHILLV